MKIVFLSNYFTHHQKPLCEKLYECTKEQFYFLETELFSDERKKMGWKSDNEATFVINKYKTDVEDISKIINDSEMIILGNAPFSLVKKKLKQKDTIIFKYSERIFKKKYAKVKWPIRIIRFWWFYGRYRRLYLLSASAYTAGDYNIHGTFLNKSYKWGYFPETMHYDICQLMLSKKKNRIVWCGRFIEWKHPEIVIEIAKRLREESYEFEIELIGTGTLLKNLREKIDNENLKNYIKILDAMSPQDVRKHMEKAGIYLFTSDFQEGWGAVLNESMNSGCAVVASHAIGSVPYLIKHGKNGVIYKNGDTTDLYKKVRYLLDNPMEQDVLGRNAYNTIVNLWNAEVAAERLLKLTKEIQKKGYCDLYDDGPCSKAKIIRNNWFNEINKDLN